MLIEALCPLHIRRPCGDLRLLPGHPVDLDAEDALRLLAKASGKVRVVSKEEIHIERATKSDGSPSSPVFWERADGSIVGPGLPEFFARVGCGNRSEDFWLVVRYGDETIWTRSDRLRSKREYDRQVLPRIIDPVKEPR